MFSSLSNCHNICHTAKILAPIYNSFFLDSVQDLLVVGVLTCVCYPPVVSTLLVFPFHAV